jgi:protein involved in polysaccharide export with SLBB domain
MSTGCAAMSNPISSGVPVRMLPKEVLARPRSELEQVPLTLLRLKEQEQYKLDKGDFLAVIAGDLFGPENLQPPVSLANPNEGTESAVGYPVPVRDDGTISMPNPKIPPIKVKGLTAVEAEDLLRRCLTGKEPGYPKIFVEGGAKISVQLLRKRRYRVNIIREDTQGIPISTGSITTQAGRRIGQQVSLEAGKNDVLTALNVTGGPPGTDGKNEVYIYRGEYDPKNPRKGQTRVPLKIFPDQQLTISEADITLNEGDILVIPGRESEVFYTGGILQSRQFALPRDYDLDIVGAIAVANGQIINGAFSQNQFVAQSIATGLGAPSPVLVNVLRKLPDGQQINIRIDLGRALQDPRERIYIIPNDIVVLQEKPGEAVLRYITQTFRLSYSWQFIRGLAFNANSTATGP